MLSSCSSLLLSALQSALSVAGGDTASPAGGEAAPGFAELLNGIAAKAAGGAPAAETVAQDGAERPIAGDAAPLAEGKPIPVDSRRPALAAKAKIADDKAVPGTPVVAAEPATATVAAMVSGKILPVVLPEAAEDTAGEDGKAAADTKTETAPEQPDAVAAEASASSPSPLAAVPGVLPLPAVSARSAEPAVAGATLSPQRAAVAQRVLARTVNPAASRPAEEPKPETQAAEQRPASAVAITVAAPARLRAPDAVEAASAERALPVRPKPARAADLARIEAPLPQVSTQSSAPTQIAQADPSAPTTNVPTPRMAAPMLSPTDIDAALDHLMAAREALMPAEAALAIDHAEFGEVSIRFEQSSDGRLSAELAAADPELQRAVTAAVAADRGPAMTSDGDNGRSAQLANHRSTNTGGTATGGDAARGERGQSGTDREAPQRHTPARSPARRPATDQHPGVFA